MTDAEIKGLKVGDVLVQTINGRTFEKPPLSDITHIGECVAERSGAFGHAFAQVGTPMGEGATLWFTVESDEYMQGCGYKTHDANGKRIRGFDLKV